MVNYADAPYSSTSQCAMAPWRCPVAWENVIIFENLRGTASSFSEAVHSSEESDADEERFVQVAYDYDSKSEVKG